MNILITDILGKEEGYLISLFNANEVEYRIVERDGVKYMVTSDHHSDRMNLTITNNIVTKVYKG